MNINFIVSLDTRYKKRDGTYAVVIRMSQGTDERTLPIPTGVSVLKKDWDDTKKEVKKSYKGVSSVTRLNNSIDTKRRHARDVVLELEANGQLRTLSLLDIKQRIIQETSNKSFFDFAEMLIQELGEANRIGSRDAYQDAINAVENFHGSKNLSFHQFTYSFLTKFETKYLAKGNGINGLAAYLRSLRAIYNKAIKAEVVDKKYYPFEKYTIKTIPTEKRAIEFKFLKAIIDLELKQGHPYFYARNYFVASYMMYGMTFMDMAYLTKASIQNGRIYYRRTKTSKLYDIKVMPALDEILSYYSALNPDSEYVFPIVKREGADLESKDVKWARKRYNKKLEDVAALCGIESRLTSYVSRHSFATQAMLSEIPLNAISSMLGHSSLKTTQIYLASLPNNILDDYNEKLLSKIC